MFHACIRRPVVSTVAHCVGLGCKRTEFKSGANPPLTIRDGRQIRLDHPTIDTEVTISHIGDLIDDFPKDPH